MHSIFELRSVAKRFADEVAVDRVSLNFRRGETTALVGPSGSGKSTLLRLCLGLAVPDEGEVLFDGASLPLSGRGADAALRQLRQRMGYVIQSGGLFPHLTAHENVALLAQHLGWTKARIAERIEELGVLAQVTNAQLERYPAELSGGQQQRVALLRALMLDPDVLLMDEPLGALDPIVRADLQDELKDLFQRLAKSVLLVTHDIEEAGYLGDQLVLMRAGRIEQQGAIEGIVAAPATPFVERFLGAQRRRQLGSAT